MTLRSAEFNPEMLSLARRSRALTQTSLSQSSGVNRGLIARYEAGMADPNDDTLSRLAEALNYPTRFFRRNSALIGLGGGAIFHRKQQSLPVAKVYQAHALAEIRRLEIVTMLNSMGETGPWVPQYPVEVYDDDVDKIARSARTVMNVPPGPVFNLTDTLERNGCVVVAHEFRSRQIDGFSQRTQYGPCFIHLNCELPPDRWRWTLAHELAHMVMHDDPTANSKLVEEQANRFAAEFLAPAREIAPFLNSLTYQKLGGLKREWKISMQALITRAYHLGAISESQRRSMFVRLAKAGYRTREPATLDPPVETPTKMMRLAEAHLDELEYSRTELRDLLAMSESELRKHYLPDGDLLDDLGINRILNS